MRKFAEENSGRREFLAKMATGAATVGLVGVTTLEGAHATPLQQNRPGLESWFDTIQGKHRIVFDAVSANDGYPVIWPYTFLNTNNGTGTPDEALSVMVILRSKAISLALEDKVWSKYKLGKLFKLVDFTTNAPSDRNLYWDPKPGEMPEIGMSIKALLARGVMFCVCETAIGMTTRQIARSKDIDAGELKKEWIEGIIKGIQVVPSGVWAVNRAQEHGCSYCSAG